MIPGKARWPRGDYRNKAVQKSVPAGGLRREHPSRGSLPCPNGAPRKRISDDSPRNRKLRPQKSIREGWPFDYFRSFIAWLVRFFSDLPGKEGSLFIYAV
jgi:hypothetical protein